MKKTSYQLLVACAIFLISCSGSDTYRGAWKAMDSGGAKFEINFEADALTIKDSAGVSKRYEYAQNSVRIENSVETYGIKLGDGRGYQINFPNADDESVGVIKDENGNMMYSISRKNYLKYEDIYRLN